ncbi:helix-turn-helix domain-containing protein [Qipengyuania sp. RANM35]|uniref:helix-turn-helix domain-containing protein n=1 Tax=Qipengyuania sp. RANM35 TaxID=3068635 RepID=UPI0034DADD33
MAVVNALHRTGFSSEQIAERTSLSRARIAELLNGAVPSMRELRALAAGLQLPLSYFSAAESERSEQLRMQFRATAQSKEGVDHSVRKVEAFVTSALKLLPVRNFGPELANFENIFSGADDVRFHLGYDDPFMPMFDLPQRVARQDGIVLSLLNKSRFEGVSLIEGNYLFIFVSPRFSPRMLFTLAHEIGHAVNGDFAAGEPIFDLPSAIGNIRKSKTRERLADKFASDFLLPELALAKFLRSLRRQLGIMQHEKLGDIEILYLAIFFGLSFDAAAMRCENLGLLPEGGAFSLSNHIKKNHGSPEKRAASLGLPKRQPIEFPRLSGLLLSKIEEALSLGDVSSGWVSENFDISISQLLDLHRQRRSNS